jgi:hypothetical protein
MNRNSTPLELKKCLEKWGAVQGRTQTLKARQFRWGIIRGL